MKEPTDFDKKTGKDPDGEALSRLIDVIGRLRGPEGCAFDRAQTLPKLLEDLREEFHELADAISTDNLPEISSEISDLFTVLLFMRQILWEKNGLLTSDLFNMSADKMIRRHPHVFLEPNPDKKIEAIWETWEAIKKTEEEHQDRKSMLDGIPKSMSALDAAQKLGKKAGRVGFDWVSADGAWEKVEEELEELSQARHESPDRLKHELGDLLLALSSYGRHLGIRTEEALLQANKRFRDRFHQMELDASLSNRALSSLSPEEWNDMWIEAKKKEGSG
ncbi:nucleoside triphosphate pyrophosphohydrolase [Leptospirillum ferrooxidans]|uniref:Putative MazG family protein n=1 Tax=Leptospirillum ferrooxidans (strain C2-3) TaxID=1162668 RepID=I0IKY9_LEPFC|nr:nucleoside triphosphate pyrophosphohydrolase [Leptospirillum ferrooxidans]BAM05938.1 putative MazG family protein [Leptospirillum ferrooxidans C2-3]